jgi:hypothetical protein
MTNQAALGWMIIATTPNGQIKAMPTSSQALDMIPTFFHGTLPTLGGVWVSEDEAYGVLKGIPVDVRHLFRVVPVMVTILHQG